MNAWRYMWQNLTRRLRETRVFTLDVDAYRTLRRVADQQQCSPQEAAARLFEQAAQEQSQQAQVMQCWDLLSPRQRQICAYVCRGDSTRLIAAYLSISPTTVKSHVEMVLRKFGVNSRVALRELLAPWDLSDYL